MNGGPGNKRRGRCLAPAAFAFIALPPPGRLRNAVKPCNAVIRPAMKRYRAFAGVMLLCRACTGGHAGSGAEPSGLMGVWSTRQECGRAVKGGAFVAVADEDRSRFTEYQLAVILREAARHSESAGSSPRRYTQAEIEQLAAEAGIDAGAVRRAIDELGVEQHGAGTWGAGARFRVARQAPREVDDAELPHLVNVMESAAGTDGLAEQIAGGLVWRARDPGGLFTITMTRGGGCTEIVATAERERDARLGLLGAVAAGTITSYVAGAALSVALPDQISVAMALVVFPFVFLGVARALRRRVARRWRRSCENVVEALIRRIAPDREA